MAQQAKKAGKTGKKKRFTLRQLKWAKGFFKTGDKRNTSKRVYNIGGKGGSKTKKQANMTADQIGQETYKKLQSLYDEHYKKQEIDIEWVMNRLVAKADLSKSEQIQLKALELIGKNKKMFTDRVELDAKGELNINIYIPDNKRDKVEAKAESKSAKNKKKEEKKHESS